MFKILKYITDIYIRGTITSKQNMYRFKFHRVKDFHSVNDRLMNQRSRSFLLILLLSIRLDQRFFHLARNAIKGSQEEAIVSHEERATSWFHVVSRCKLGSFTRALFTSRKMGNRVMSFWRIMITEKRIFSRRIFCYNLDWYNFW